MTPLNNEHIWKMYKEAKEKDLDMSIVYKELADHYEMPIPQMKNIIARIRRDKVTSGETPPDNFGNADRTDFWTKEEDDKVAEIIIESVMEGNLIKEAIQKAADAVNRTVPGVNVRWNTILKLDYIKEFEEAKKIGEPKRNSKISEVAKNNRLNKLKKNKEGLKESVQEVQLAFSVPLCENVKEEEIPQEPEILEQNDIDDKMLRVTINIIMDRLEAMQTERDHYKILYEKEKEKTEKLKKIFEEV